jgi:hypothetical protein
MTLTLTQGHKPFPGKTVFFIFLETGSDIEKGQGHAQMTLTS